MKKKMNPKTKRAVVVLSIIALIIFIIGLVSCSIQLSQKDPSLPAVTDSDNPAPTPGDKIVIPKIDQGSPGNLPDDTIQQGTTDSKPEETENGGKDTEQGKDKPYPAKPTEKPPVSPKPVKPADPTMPPVTPTPKPTVPPASPTPKPSEPVKPTEPPKQEEKPSTPDKPGGGGSGGGSTSYPAAVVEILIPEYSHADMEFEVKTTLRNVKSLDWNVAEDGKDTPQGDFLKGTLDKNGGKITITQPGQYVLTAAAQNYGNRAYTFTKKITIHPTIDIKIEADKAAHTDQSFVVKTTLSDNVKQQLNWHIYKDGSEVKWQEAVTGSLANDGGSIQIKDKGSYILKATAYDETSREFFGKADVEVYPIIEIGVQAPVAAHTDTPVTVAVNTKELGDLTLAWTVTKDGKEISLADCMEGKLDNTGGTVCFLGKGDYSLTATATDKAGRAFSGKADIKIYPVAAFSFDLPATTHTDKPATVKVVSSELQDMTAEWTVLYNGEITPLTSVLEGSLTNEGGTVRFKQKGSYTLKAILLDALGREYKHEASTVVYPVAETGFYIPSQVHTDTAVEVKTSFQETAGLTAEWSLTKDGKPITLVDGFDGTLTNDGGKIRFNEVGEYNLQAAVTDSTGRSFTYTAPVKVYPVITVVMELTKETHTDKAATASVKLSNAGSLPVAWSMAKDNVPVQPEHELTDKGGSIRFLEKGSYTVTAAVTDEAGRTFEDSKTVKIYPIPGIAFSLPAAVHTDDMVTVDTILTDMEGLTAVWYVDNTFGFQDWAVYIDGQLNNQGGSIHFKRAGVYDLQARVTDATGRVFHFNSGKIEVLPVLSLSFELPATAHTDTQIEVRTRGNNNVLPVEWSLMKNGTVIPLEQAVSGSLNAQGGKIRFTGNGEYRLTASMTDALGRMFTASSQISIFPLYNCDFSMPAAIHTGQNFVINMSSSINLNGKSIVWTATKDGAAVAVSDFFKGTLDNGGGTVHVDTAGSYQLTASITDELNRVFAYTQTITITNTAPSKPTLTADVTRTYADGKFLVNLTAASTDPDGDMVIYEFEGKNADNYYPIGNHTVRVRAKDSYGGVSDWTTATFTVANAAPGKPAFSASVTRTAKNGSFLVNFSVSSTDPDGDTVIYEYQNMTADRYYPVGTHTVKVRAKDNYGGVSDWAVVTFTVANSAPTTPVITRTPNGNSVAPGTAVTIKAASTDPDGDAITYVWEGRNAETQTYPLGKNTVRVKAVDSTGAESSWAAIIFFVADPNRGGGMTLTGPESTIIEDGVDGATITSWTFTVPAVSGHSASYDYGQVRGYNRLTGRWEQLPTVSFDSSIGSSFAATDGNPARVYSYNGVHMYGTLQAGIYTKLEFYYFTPHTCMYNKSNITYSVEFFFE